MENKTDSANKKQNLKDVKVLIVEDSADNRFLMERILAKTGAQIVFAENGEVGVSKATTDGFDVILMDIQMPVVDGYEAVRILRQEKAYDRPIIALTANAMADEEALCLERGFDDYLVKPISPKDLIDKLLAYAQKSNSAINGK